MTESPDIGAMHNAYRNANVGGEKPTNLAGMPSGVAAVLVTTKQLAERYQVVPRYIQLLTERGILPVVKLGRRCVRYNVNDSDDAMSHFTVRAAVTSRKARAALAAEGRA